ncbi:PhoH family protein [Faecalicatena sp. AGMB00832]|uniref:PhoH family protein n=1 Tax=Faecalicatena faecalis TaxID=2726362 RepID=A0ABS6D5B4_9FIRM|nr:PhoH family protein [Faecalicatena faecalis]
MSEEREVFCLEDKYLRIGTVEQIQSVFGPQDKFIRTIEEKLHVSITARESELHIMGAAKKNVELTADILVSMFNIHSKGGELNVETIHRLIEEAADGTLLDVCNAMDESVITTHRGTPIRCRTAGQKEYIKSLRNDTITVCIGPAGTGKTFLAVAQAVRELENKEIDRIILSRPAIEAGSERLGFLPGDLNDKIDPYLRPLYDALNDILGPERVASYRERDIIEVAALGYMRGRTLNRSRLILDESQNSKLEMLKMCLTRLGEGSKMALVGDVTQSDLSKSDSGLEKCASIIKSVEGVGIVQLGNKDVVRSKIVRDILRAFDVSESKAAEKRNPGRGKSNIRKKK